jgi:hypothetical protein
MGDGRSSLLPEEQAAGGCLDRHWVEEQVGVLLMVRGHG